MTSDDRSSSVKVYIVYAALAAIGSWAMGNAYAALRFLANYKVTEAEVSACDSYLDRGHTSVPVPGGTLSVAPLWYFTLHVQIEGNDYQIHKVSAVSSGDNPRYDWCTFKNKVITVYYYDKLGIATTLWDQNPRPGPFTLLFSIESQTTMAGLFILALVGMAGIYLGLRLFLRSLFHVSSGVRLPTTCANRPGTSCLKYFNHLVVPLSSVVLTVILVIMLGLLWIKGLLYVEGKSIPVLSAWYRYTSGLLLLIGAFVVIYGPGLLLKGVYYLKHAESEILKAIQNLIILGALSKLVANATAFFWRHDFTDEASTRELIGAIISALLS